VGAAEISGVRAAASLLGLVIAMALGYWVYRAELVAGPGGNASTLVDQANVAGVKTDLISIGQAERLYLTGHDTYATLDQLHQEGSVPFQSRHGYSFKVEVDGAQHFKAVATPDGATRTGWPVLFIDDSMQVTEQ
jgi:hypothetical protein